MIGSADAMEIAELKRRLDNLVQIGVIAEVQPDVARAVARIGARVTQPLQWLTQRAGADKDWWAPSLGEQVLVLSPGGDPEQAVILPAIYSDANPAPSGDPALRVVDLSGGLVLRCGAAQLTFDANGLHVVGPIRSTDEVAAGDIELTTHVHADVTPGAAQTGEPEPASGAPL
ncbi:MAG: phage baseplate assembly protein V [Pseudomonadota bacterium]